MPGGPLSGFTSDHDSLTSGLRRDLLPGSAGALVQNAGTCEPPLMHVSRTIAPVPVTSPLVPGAVVAGYRLIRQVAGSAGDSTWLARAPGTDDETLCVSVLRGTEAVTRRVEAHSRIRSLHVLTLVDLATDGEGRIVLACERTDWSLATLLASRSQLAPGEAVTVLAPIAAGLAAIHHAGLSHGELTASAVLFCPDGRPVLGRLDALREVRDSSLEDDRPPPEVLSDYRSLGNLISAVAQLVEETAGQGLLEVSDWIDAQLRDGSATGSFLGEIECRVFALAPALPVILVADRRPVTSGSRSGSGSPADFSGSPSRRAATALPGLSGAAVALGRSGVVAWIQRVLHGRALALCLGIVLLVALLIVGLAAIPERVPASASRPPEGKQTRADAPTEQTDTTPTATTSPAESDAPDDAGVVTREDAVAATEFLLRLRAQCANTESAACVSRYAEPGSALADADTHAFDQSRRERLLLNGADTVVQFVQAYGNAVLVRATTANEKRQPVLVLAVRTDTGWRLRDLFEPD
jgi:hypothetical protein